MHFPKRVKQPVTTSRQNSLELAVSEIQTDFVAADLYSLEQNHGCTSFLVRDIMLSVQWVQEVEDARISTVDRCNLAKSSLRRRSRLPVTRSDAECYLSSHDRSVVRPLRSPVKHEYGSHRDDALPGS